MPSSFLDAPADVTVSQVAAMVAASHGAQAAIDAVEEHGPAVAALEVTWDAVTIPSGGKGGYYVQRFAEDSTTPSAACGSSPSSPLSPTTTGCTDSGLVPGTSYQYQVVAVYDSWIAPSAVSNAVILPASTLNSFTVTPSTSAPTAGTPFNVTVTALDQYGDTYAVYPGPNA